MDWFEARVDGPMVIIRGIHFAATAVMAGVLTFRAVVTEPVLRDEPAAARVQMPTRLTASIALAISAVSGVIWLYLQAMSMSGLSIGDTLTSDQLSIVVNQTQFGQVSQIRFVLAIILAGCLCCDRMARARRLGLGAALGLTVAVAWTGHGASTMGELGALHLAADVLHLVAAAAWFGGLVSLVRLLAGTRGEPALVRFTAVVIRRFSTLGIMAVGTLLLTGAVNSWILVGSFHALAVTGYGRLLALKVGLFALMVGLAAVNRLRLTPKLFATPALGPACAVLGQLSRNSLIEIALGVIIFAIVGVLGTLHPAIHLL